MQVEVTKRALKSLAKLPKAVVQSFDLWKQTVEIDGIEAMRTVVGYNDEALHGKLKGVRSS